DKGNTVVVIEHNLDVIKNADWVIDMGLEGGVGGGEIIAEGTPEQVAEVTQSHTGRFLGELFSPEHAEIAGCWHQIAYPTTYRPKPGEIPTDPGVYRFYDQYGRVIYVGKAKNLRTRLSTYFQDIAALHPRTQQMVTTAHNVQWTVVAN